MRGSTKAPSFIFSSTNPKQKKNSEQNSQYVNQTQKQEILSLHTGNWSLTLLKSCMYRQIFRMQLNGDGSRHIRQGECRVAARIELILWYRSV